MRVPSSEESGALGAEPGAVVRTVAIHPPERPIARPRPKAHPPTMTVTPWPPAVPGQRRASPQVKQAAVTVA